MNTTFKTTGKLIYDPIRKEMKKSHRNQPGWLILEIDNNISEYYRWWVKKYTGWILNGQAFGSHVTIINDKDKNVTKHKCWKKYHNKKIEIEISVEMEQHWHFFVLPVFSKELINIRKELGLPDRKTPFHLTIGRI